jgi:hypothetical protein
VNKLFQGYVQELQAEINQELLETMHATELEDWGTFGKIRQAEEKRLRDPDDVFIHAQERKKRLRENAGKPSARNKRRASATLVIVVCLILGTIPYTA